MNYTHWKDLPYFTNLDADSLARIEMNAHRHSYQAGATIFNEGDRCSGFQVVLEGLVRIYRVSPEGRLHTLSLLRPAASFNEVAAVDGSHNPYNAMAVTNVDVLVWSHNVLMELLSR